MTKYGVMHTTNVSGKCFSLVYINEIENGSFVAKGDLLEGEQSIYRAEVPTVNDKVYVVGQPAWSYEDNYSTDQNEDAYIVPEATVFRAYDLEVNDKVAITDYSFNGAPAKGKFVTMSGGDVKATVVDAMPTGNAFIAVINEVRELGFAYSVGSVGTIDNTAKMVVIEVIKNG